MGKRFDSITPLLQAFIERQHVFFVGTAAPEGRVNLSPKGMDTLRVLDERRIVWLNLTGSGNETAAHVRESDRMTLMFCAFEGDPVILRAYGRATAIHPRDRAWETLFSLFPPLPGARQIFDLQVDLVQTSCGMGVPRFDYAGPREQLIDWANAKGETGLYEYWQRRNIVSLDGNPTGIFE